MNKLIVKIRTFTNLVVGRIKNEPLPVFILCYHGIGQSKYIHNISASTFSDQIDYLSKHAHFVTLEDIEQFIVGKKSLKQPSVAITFDDGYQSLLSIRSTITRYKLQPALFVLSNPEKANRVEMANQLPLLSISEIQTLKKEGWDVGLHSATHADLSHLNYSELTKEIKIAKKTLENKIKSKVKYFAYPKGAYTSEAVSVVKKSNFNLALTMDDNPIEKGSDPYTISRIGINSTHSNLEFPTLITNWSQKIRKILK